MGFFFFPFFLDNDLTVSFCCYKLGEGEKGMGGLGGGEGLQAYLANHPNS